MKLSSQSAMVTIVFPLISAIIFAFDASFPLCFAFEAFGFGVSDDRTGQLGFRDNITLFLPLTHSWSIGGRLPQGAHYHGYRRHLKKAGVQNLSSAQMPLFDDLLLNGYYTTRLYLGTPPQEFALIVDTGSTVTYVPCSGCENCGKHQDPRFQPELSSTYKPIKCNIDCTCDEDEEVCVYERRYAEMSSSSGVLAEDVVSLGNKSNLVQQRVVFGCEIAETGDLFSQRADGIMGLGRGDLSIMDQLVDKGAIGDSFSLCYGGMDVGGGAMIIGAYPSPSGMVFTHSDPKRSPFYNIELKEIHVAGKPLRLKPSIFDGKYGTVLDSGTTYAYFPEEVYLAFNASIHNNVQSLKQIPGPDPNYGDICFAGAGRDASSLSKTFPPVDMVFSNGHKLHLSPENYLFRHTKVPGAYCLGVFQNGNDPTTLLGGIVVRNTLVTYDRANERVGFWKTNCSELWKSQNMSVAAAVSPSASSGRGNNVKSPPMQAPSSGGLNINALSGESRVGQITFEMSFPRSNSSTKPNLTQLCALIAKELDINATQVHLLNFIPQGNYSLARWAINPVDSSTCISSSKAMSIITRLNKHQIQLQGLGSYQVLGWHLKSQTKRESAYRIPLSLLSLSLELVGHNLSISLNGKPRSNHHLKVITGGIGALVILSLTTLCVIWRQRKRHPYELVGSAASVPDQELQLQPL